ncbi:hypothetical protein LTS10_004080 [Elasticomyces elasticus]|nr:hypothetical protein LTS10_004080 [Elasticomyces elasticus]
MPSDKTSQKPGEEGCPVVKDSFWGWLPDEALKTTRQIKNKRIPKHRPGEGRAHQHQKAPGDIVSEKQAARPPRPHAPTLPKLTNIYEYLYLVDNDFNGTSRSESSRTKKLPKTKSPPGDCSKLNTGSPGNDVVPSRSRPHKEHHAKHEGRRNRQLTTPESGHQSNDIDATAGH